MKRLFCSALFVSLLSLVLCGCEEKDTVVQVETPAIQQAPVETPQVEVPVVEEILQVDVTETEEFKTVIKTIEDTYSEMDGFDSITIERLSDDYVLVSINTKIEDFAYGLVMFKDNAEIRESWQGIIELDKESSLMIRESFVLFGMDEVHVAFNILNDLNPDNVLSSVVDGEVQYNIIDDIK